MAMHPLLKCIPHFILFLATGCGTAGSTSGSHPAAGTSYNGTITQIYTPGTVGREQSKTPAMTCRYSGNLSVQMNDDGSITLTSSTMGGQNYASCAILSEIYNATSLSGAGTGTVIITTAEGETSRLSVTFSFQATSAQDL